MKKFSMMLRPLAVLALIIANSATTNTSFLWLYQPKFPDKLREQ